MNYQTLQGRDLLLPERQFGVMMKNGYSSRNREWTNTLGFGMDNGSVDAALLYSQRRGHETESAGNRGYDGGRQGQRHEYPRFGTRHS